MTSIYNNVMLWVFGRESYGVVYQVLSGDTYIFIDIATKMQYKIKLYNVETPKEGQKYHKRAKKLVESILIKEDKRVMVKLIVQHVESDIAYVDLYYPTEKSNKTDGSKYLLQDTLVSRGYAFVRNKNINEELYLLQEHAKIHNQGAWSIEGFVCPWEFKSSEFKIRMKK
jgi:endonuclease YncB( thermonuclease family)